MTVLLENGAISEEFVLFIDKIHLQKKVQYHSGEFAGADKKRNFVQRRCCFHDCITKIFHSICCKIFT